MATIVLRVRLLGGDHTDLMYEDPDHDDEAALIDHVVEVMSERSGVSAVAMATVSLRSSLAVWQVSR